MSLKSDIDLLAAVPFFSGFSREHLRLIGFSAENRSLPQDMVLYEEGQFLHSAYIVKSGTLVGEHGGTTRTIEPGTLIAERALIVDMKAPETVTVSEPVESLQIRRSIFRRFLEEYPEMAAAIRGRMAQRLRMAAGEYSRVSERLNAIDL